MRIDEYTSTGITQSSLEPEVYRVRRGQILVPLQSAVQPFIRKSCACDIYCVCTDLVIYFHGLWRRLSLEIHRTGKVLCLQRPCFVTVVVCDGGYLWESLMQEIS